MDRMISLLTVITLHLLLTTRLSGGDFLNVAQSKPANMSSTHRHGSLPAGGANDGVITTVRPQVIITASGQTSAWWRVDLQTQVQDAVVELYFRTDYKYRRNGVQLYTSSTSLTSTRQGQLCHNVTGRSDGTDIPDVVQVTCPGRWSHLMVYTETSNDGDGPVLDFGEVRVLACAKGMYGENCDKLCIIRHCQTSFDQCEPVNGTCKDGCEPGWNGTNCAQVCDVGMYGANCGKSCSSRHCVTPSSNCDHVTGVCDNGCTAGWNGTDCMQVCTTGAYGVNCSQSCSSRHCGANYSCNRISGECSGGCSAGWNGNECTHHCPSGTYGINCLQVCTTRHCRTMSSPCDRENGQCPEDGCQDGWIGKDCTQECSYDAYGRNCSKLCSKRNCDQDHTTCDHITGECRPGGCTRGYRWPDCTQKCSDRYGKDCNMLCSKRNCAVVNTTCDHITGECRPGGCKRGYRLPDCTQECETGMYGMNCTKHCISRHCRTSSNTCHHVTGDCVDGCEDGWIGDDCIQAEHISKDSPGVYKQSFSSVTAGLIGGTVAALVVILFLIGGLFLYFLKIKRRSENSNGNPINHTEHPVEVSEDGALYAHPDDEDISYLYVSHHHQQRL